LAMRPSQMLALLGELERRIDALSGTTELDTAPPERGFDELEPSEQLAAFLEVATADLRSGGQDAVVVVGESLGPDAVAAGIRINSKLGSLGRLLRFLPVADRDLGETVTLPELVERLNSGRIETLVILGDNPAFTAPGDVRLADAIARAENSIYVGEYHDETSVRCTWSVPQAHPLESWGDCIGDDGL